MNKKAIARGLLILGSALLWQSDSFASSKDPEVVKEVSLDKYVGFWFEVAHAPNFFQRGCVRSTAEYAAMTPTTMTVHNVCYKADGSIRDIDGVAKITDLKEAAKLKVRFSFFQKGDYWIIDLDPNYQWAVVSAPRKKSLFILTRQVPMDPIVLSNVLKNLKQRGFAVEKLVYDALPQ